MNRLHIYGMMALAVAGLVSCEPDDSPKIQEPTEFVLNTPPFADQLYALQRGNTIELTCSQPNYGLTVAPEYNVEVSLYEDFGASLPAPDPEDTEAAPYSVVVSPVDPNSAVITLEDSSVSDAILAMRGITEESQYTPMTAPLYVRAIASINNQAITRIVSNTVTLAAVQDYFSLVPELPLLYTPGNSNGWNHENSMKLLGYKQDEKTGEWINYRGLVYLDGEFKFTSAPDWNTGINYGDTGTEGTLSTDGGAGNLKLPATGAGLYFADVDVKELTYTLTFVTSFGLVGDFQGWNAASPSELEHSDDFKTWTLTTDFGNGGGFKAIINGPTSDWKLNYGGPEEEMTFDGPNMNIAGGSHTVTIDLSEIPYKTTIE